MSAVTVRGLDSTTVVDDQHGDPALAGTEFDGRRRRPRVTGDVRQRLTDDGEDLGGVLDGDRRIDRTVESDLGVETEGTRRLGTDVEHSATQ